VCKRWDTLKKSGLDGLIGISGATLAAPGKFEVKRLGAVEHKMDGMAVSSSSYSASYFSGAAHYQASDTWLLHGYVISSVL
jgi:hypothetical protein